jgi:hypothetical protein
MTKPIKDNLRALGLGLAMLPALANEAQAAPASNSPANHGASLVTSKLGAGKTIATATPQELASAVKQAIHADPKQAKAIVKGVFSQLRSKDSAKALAVIDAVQAAVAAGDLKAGELPGLVRAAVEALSTQGADGTGLSARSVLGPLITQEAAALVPSEATAIANAVGSILSSAGGGPAPINFQGPGGVSNPANFSNSSGSVNSPSS